LDPAASIPAIPSIPDMPIIAALADAARGRLELFEAGGIGGLVILGELAESRLERTRMIAIMPKSEWKMSWQW
jgi:hypothetical protein